MRDAVHMSQIDSGSIVVATDGSDHAHRAVRWAAQQAAAERRRLTVFSSDADAAADVAAAQELVKELAPEVDVQVLTSQSDPRETLLEMSREAYLIVLGSRGRGAVKSLLLGSVSKAVSSAAECPVVVCRPSGDRERTGVIVGADGTPESRPVIEFAYRQASLRRQPLTVLHCYWDAAAAVAQYHRSRQEPYNAPDLAVMEAMLSESVAGFEEIYPDVAVTLDMKHGLVDAALSERGDTCDLIVVGRHPMNSLSRMVTGSIATSVVERSRTNVAVVPEELPAS